MSSYPRTKEPGVLRTRVFGDCHLGNRRTSTLEVLDGLYDICKVDADFALLDMIIIEGDLFDSGLPLYHENIHQIQMWMAWLISQCSKHKVGLRVLEGTPSHDMHQSKQFEVLVSAMGLPIDFKYVSTLFLEEHPDGYSILYVPDEWSTSHEDTYVAAKELLDKHGYKRVTFAIMHGAFEYQLPNIDVVTHDSKLWSQLVEHCIFVGHIHQFSINGVIVACGSTDRFTHGDEKPKGHVNAYLSNSGCKFAFIENKKAKKFITVDCKNLSVDAALTKIDKAVKGLPSKSHVRYQYLKQDNMNEAIGTLMATYPEYIWTGMMVEDGPKVIRTLELLPKKAFTSTSITKENIADMLQLKMSSKLNESHSPGTLDRAMGLLRQN